MIECIPATRLMPTLPPPGISCLVRRVVCSADKARLCPRRRRVSWMPARRMSETVCPACTSAVSSLAQPRGESARHACVQAARGRVFGSYVRSYGRRSGTFARRYSRTGSPPRLSPETALRSVCLRRPRSRKDGLATPHETAFARIAPGFRRLVACRGLACAVQPLGVAQTGQQGCVR